MVKASSERFENSLVSLTRQLPRSGLAVEPFLNDCQERRIDVGGVGLIEATDLDEGRYPLET